MVVDRFGRPVTSVRISVTQRCNLACIYCHREGEQAAHEEMTVEEISRIVEAAASLGISKVKLTGGEPLLREDILDIVSAISSTPGVEEVSMTTNGVLLKDMAWKL
ncbi:MAG TPA: radical SAM protein, partial [Candidatus Bathyarchaeota archaeon]|nr:radical SAM protein [Candidatus Bathyarchaeota archaeon]